MEKYPEVVAQIVTDYLQRLKSRLSMIPFREREEFLREIESHIFEAYSQAQDEDEIARVLGVLRKLGEPAEVVADRLPESIFRSGAKWSRPLYVVGGILLAVFGIPLGFGGMAVLAGVLVAITGLALAYYATAGMFVLTGSAVFLLGINRMYHPEVWDQLVAMGAIQVDRDFAQFLDLLSPSSQGSAIVLLGSVFIVVGLAMLWLGKYLLRGLRFLFSLGLNWIRQLAHRIGTIVRQPRSESEQTKRIVLHPVQD